MDENESDYLQFENLQRLPAEKVEKSSDEIIPVIKDLTRRLEVLEKELTSHKIASTPKELKDGRNEIGFRDKVRKKPTKSASFNDRSTSRTRHHSPKRHTVPSDKEEALRKEEFRNDCLSKAIKFNTVDTINSYLKNQNTVTLKLPPWLTPKERTLINKKDDIRYQARELLCVVRDKDFHTQRKWIEEESGLDRVNKDHIWKTFEEFNDEQLIMKSMCVFCMLKMKVNVAHVIDHFYSIEMISDKLYAEINASSRPVGFQDELWVKLGAKCLQFPIPSYVYKALRLAIEDILNTAKPGHEKQVLEQILEGIEQYREHISDMFVCKCRDICSKELQPMSVLKNMSLLNVYASPPSKRKANKTGEPIQELYQNSDLLSSNDSVESNLQMKPLIPTEEESYFDKDNSINNNFSDDRFRSIKTGEIVHLSRRHKKSHRKTNDAEQTYRKTVDKTCYDGCEDTEHASQENDVDRTNLEESNTESLTRFSAYEFGLDAGFMSYDKECSFRTDSTNSSTDLRAKTQKLFGTQQCIKESAKGDTINIKAGQVYIQSTHVLQSRYTSSSTDSASP